MIASFARRGFIGKTRSAADARESILTLMPRGKAIFTRLNERASADVGRMLESVPPADRTRLVVAMSAIESALGSTDAPHPPFTIREHGPGDIGWIIQRHAQIYTEEYAWNSNFELLCAEIATNFLKNLKPTRERCWIAERDGVNVGCVMMVERSRSVAQLRLLLVEPSARGLGIGANLVSECVAFAREAGYRKMMLWTNNVLHSARKIYQSQGFDLIKEEQHSKFGPPLTSQTWAVKL